jgi:hypothetical protein
MASPFCGQIASAWSGAGERSGGRPQLVLAFDAAALLDRLEMEAFVSPSIVATRGARLFGAIAIRWFPTGPGSSRDGLECAEQQQRIPVS